MKAIIVIVIVILWFIKDMIKYCEEDGLCLEIECFIDIIKIISSKAIIGGILYLIFC